MKRKIRIANIEVITGSTFGRRTLKFTQVSQGVLVPCYEGITQTPTSATYSISSRDGFMKSAYNNNYIVKEDGSITRIITNTVASDTTTVYPISIPNFIKGESIKIYLDIQTTSSYRSYLYTIANTIALNEAFFNTLPFYGCNGYNGQARFLSGDFKYLGSGVNGAFIMSQTGSWDNIKGKLSDLDKGLVTIDMISIQPMGISGYDRLDMSQYALRKVVIKTSSNILTHEEHANFLEDLLNGGKLTEYTLTGNQNFAIRDGELRVRAKDKLGSNLVIDGIAVIALSGNSKPISNSVETYSLDLVPNYSIFMTEWSVNNGATIVPNSNKVNAEVTFPTVTKVTTFTISCIVDKTFTRTFTATVSPDT